MLKLDLARLERERLVRIRGDVPADDPLWEGTGMSFQAPLSVDLRAQQSGSGEVVVRGALRGVLQHECRRCLDPVRTELSQSLTLVYVPTDLLGEDEGGDEVRPIPHDAAELNLGDAIREELILAVDPYVVCDPRCRGLCPRCGVDRNEETCDCVRDERDPRWDVLRTLKGE
jgi:uncharacterized protein